MARRLEFSYSSEASATNLLRALYLVAKPLLALTLLCLCEMGLLHLLYLRNPGQTDTAKELNVDHLIVLEQVDRAATLPASEIAFFGDSSCLMGIDPRAIEQTTGLTPIESFCSIGYVGPSGYAYMLNKMIEHKTAPKTLVLMFHPATFRREPSWESWPDFVKNADAVVQPRLTFPSSALNFLQFEWLTRLVYSPLPGAYGRYYGGADSFRSSIRAKNGSAIDPSTGLDVTSAETLKAVPTPPSGQPADFSANQPYRIALKILAETISHLPPETRVYLVLSPVPDNSYREASTLQRDEQSQEIATALGIDPKHILKTPQTMFQAFFSSYTHLNRWGRVEFSQYLAKTLADQSQSAK